MAHEILLVLIRSLAIYTAYVRFSSSAFACPVIPTAVGTGRMSSFAIISLLLVRLAFRATVKFTGINRPRIIVAHSKSVIQID